MKKHRRTSGILLHITSLPGRWGIGETGPAARDFGSRLAENGVRWWQVLPVGPTGYGDSPYQSFSSFAGNPLLISFDDLIADGLLDPSRLDDFPGFSGGQVDYGAVIPARMQILREVCRDFSGNASAKMTRSYNRFLVKESGWLADYALFMALKEEHGGRPWQEWEPALRHRDPDALQEAGVRLYEQVNEHCLMQFLFALQWKRLRRHLDEAGVGLIGDIPIFVAMDSADVWACPELFDLNDDLSPRVVAGVPPDYFSRTGQLWGNPLYRWAVHGQDGFAWWKRRLERMIGMFDLVRIDHFRGFEKYWEVPAGEQTAENGEWVDGPGIDFFRQMRKEFGRHLPLIAEDLGVITPEVDQLREEAGLPGMTVLQFRFGWGDLQKPGYRPEGTETDRVIYTGTHDNDTTAGWFGRPFGETDGQEAEEQQLRESVCRYVGDGPEEINWKLIRFALNAPAQSAVFPLQDVLGLGSEARMNRPGTDAGNWRWRVTEVQLQAAGWNKLKEMIKESGRI